jgi:hypothetical protein
MGPGLGIGLLGQGGYGQRGEDVLASIVGERRRSGASRLPAEAGACGSTVLITGETGPGRNSSPRPYTASVRAASDHWCS